MQRLKIMFVFLCLLTLTVSLYAIDWRKHIKAGGEAVNDNFGNSASCVGDVNGDGYKDIIVSAPRHNFGGNTEAGAAYIFFGGSSMDSIFDVKMGGEAEEDNFGYSASCAGDVNGDGYDDVIVGSPRYNFGGNTGAGAAYIFLGGSSMDSIFDVKMGGEAIKDIFGYSVSCAGDVNGDGYDDVIVGACYNDFGGNTDAGAAYIFYG
ncbi:FG-GAP repeat protein, partial [candidate division WOR-3 bacterium]|nr:FG-GAP repeat protein [candidate division WOR-3 bacterium]